ncbi:DUF3846 domain-containing protein [Paramicrobacterium agarici]|uniref:DUF3846 domain-containing protein n=1 Tax=Paramicrobacterium agarici TaxID=630514 RepID=UPI00114F504C|nr:DUF3846 domain-containing protein [Microbacterium agarici]TQO21466.1 uncharacterized protein DUF3846 [Microbacterium agarici]
MVQGIAIPADPDEPLREFDTAAPDAIATAVGGLMEAVDLFDLGITIFVNESGVLQHLPFNSRASFLWWHQVPAARRSPPVGDAAIVGLPDDDGADTEVPAGARNLLFNDADYLVEVRLVGDDQWQIGLPIRLDYWDALMWATLLLEQVPELMRHASCQPNAARATSHRHESQPPISATAATAQSESFALSAGVVAALFTSVED